jgi:5-formyltetrahydrofolate cyclo-ligase
LYAGYGDCPVIIGYDHACYRPGYDGGFFDRTLAAMQPKPRIIGAGSCAAEIPAIYPQ